MAGGGGGGKLWIGILIAGLALVGVAYGLGHADAGPAWLEPLLLAVGGLGVVFGSCEAMINCVEKLGERLRWNPFVAGTMAGLASNVPEVVMLAFVVLKEPRVAFVIVALTLHVSALVFGIYSGVLRRDPSGKARLPKALVSLSTDLHACAAGVFLATASLMLVLRLFDTGDHRGEGLGVGDLYAIGVALLVVEVVNVVRLVQRFSAVEDEGAETPTAETPAEETPAEETPAPQKDAEAPAPPETPAAASAPGWGIIAFFGVLGTATSVVGGHAVGEFAEHLVNALTSRGYTEMVGAIILSVFACSGAFLMLATAHAKGRYDIAMASASGQITQVPFVVLPVVMILMAIFAQSGAIPFLPHGGVLAIDFETTLVMLFGFPTMLILWKSIQDDGTINWLETASMIALFGLNIYFLAQHS